MLFFRKLVKTTTKIYCYNSLPLLALMPPLVQLFRLCQRRDELLIKLREWHLIPNEGDYKCPHCGSNLHLQDYAKAPDGWVWRCKALVKKYEKSKWTKCETTIEFRLGTFFDHMKISILQVWKNNVNYMTQRKL